MQLIGKIRDHGIKWFFQRMLRELQSPTRTWTQRPIDALIRAKRALFDGGRREPPYLRAVYDLEVGANTYDFACFLVAAEIEATRRGLAGYEIVILPRYRKDLYENEYAVIVDDAAQQWRVQALLVPLTYLSAKCRGVLVARERGIANAYLEGQTLYPDLYGPWSLRGIDYADFYRKAAQTPYEGLAGSEQARKAVSRWLTARGISRPLAVITLRGYGHDPARDSNLPEWRKLSHHLAGLGLQPVVIPEVDVAADDLSAYDFSGELFVEACWNLDLRMAMYEAAHVNLFVNNGPAQLAALSRKCRYIIFKWSTPHSPLATVEFHRSRGLEPGKPFPFALPGQQLVWEEDSYAVMARHVDAFLGEFPPRGGAAAT